MIDINDGETIRKVESAIHSGNPEKAVGICLIRGYYNDAVEIATKYKFFGHAIEALLESPENLGKEWRAFISIADIVEGDIGNVESAN